jgi:hypothetical protein
VCEVSAMLWRLAIGDPLTLAELVDQLSHVGDDLTVYAEEPWTANAQVVVAVETEEESSPSEMGGFAYLLEVFLIRDVLAAWSSHRAGARPTTEQTCAAIIHYARHDAYLFADE